MSQYRSLRKTDPAKAGLIRDALEGYDRLGGTLGTSGKIKFVQVLAKLAGIEEGISEDMIYSAMEFLLEEEQKAVTRH